MRRVRLLVLAAMAMFAFGALSAAVANAEDGQPQILLLSGNISELQGTFTGKGSTLSTLAGKQLIGTGVSSTLKGCEALKESALDGNLCKNVTITFTGVKQGAVNCRSEMADGTQKDAIETVLVVVDLHLAAEENAAKELQPLLLFKVLGALPSETGEELTINCGGVKNKVKGVIGCLLLPGLTNIETTKEATISCAFNTTTHDPTTGTCEKLCEWLKEHPFESNLGAGFEDAGMGIEVKGKFTKDIFIDD